VLDSIKMIAVVTSRLHSNPLVAAHHFALGANRRRNLALWPDCDTTDLRLKCGAESHSCLNDIWKKLDARSFWPAHMRQFGSPYTEQARRTMFFGRYEARQFGSPYIESEHLLIGLLREDKALARTFLPHGGVESIRKGVEGQTVIREKVPTSGV
jgi:hypothetical protein